MGVFSVRLEKEDLAWIDIVRAKRLMSRPGHNVTRSDVVRELIAAAVAKMAPAERMRGQ